MSKSHEKNIPGSYQELSSSLNKGLFPSNANIFEDKKQHDEDGKKIPLLQELRNQDKDFRSFSEPGKIDDKSKIPTEIFGLAQNVLNE